MKIIQTTRGVHYAAFMLLRGLKYIRTIQIDKYNYQFIFEGEAEDFKKINDSVNFDKNLIIINYNSLRPIYRFDFLQLDLCESQSRCWHSLEQ